MKVEIRSCDDCSLCAHSPGDGLWFCNHPTYQKDGTFLNVTRPDGTPFKRGVSQRCPLREDDAQFTLAEGVEFI